MENYKVNDYVLGRLLWGDGEELKCKILQIDAGISRDAVVVEKPSGDQAIMLESSIIKKYEELTTTPAPWFLEDDGSIVDQDGYLIAHTTPFANVNTVSRYGFTFNITDGRLIAAAPDLLNACQKALTLNDDGSNREEVFNQLKDAIKKATDKSEINYTKICFDGLKNAIKQDDDYAWTWFCNIAMPMQDQGITHQKANESAASIMKLFFDVDITKFDYYKAFDWNESDDN